MSEMDWLSADLGRPVWGSAPQGSQPPAGEPGRVPTAMAESGESKPGPASTFQAPV